MAINMKLGQLIGSRIMQPHKIAPMTSINVAYSVYISRPVDATAKFMMDINNIREWMPDVRSYRQTSEGAFQYGTNFNHKISFGPTILEFKSHVTSYSPLKQFVISGKANGVWMRRSWFFEPVLRGTRVHYKEETEKQGLLTYLFRNHYESRRQEQIERGFQKLKRKLEGQKVEYKQPHRLDRSRGNFFNH